MQGSDWAPEEEAEAALRVLEGQLNWKVSTVQEWDGYLEQEMFPTYSVTKVFQTKPMAYAAVVLFGAPHHDRYRLYGTLEEAQAACQRHYVTGKWGRETEP